MLYQNLCPTCGAELQKLDKTKYGCQSCGNVYSVEKIENYADNLKEILDVANLEAASNAKKNLYAAITANNISKNEVERWCNEVKKYIPDDFQANFYYDFIKLSHKEVAKNIRKIDEKKHFEVLEPLIVFVSKSLERSYVASIKDLIERAYKLGDRDLEKYIKYITLIENEAEKVYNGVYDIKKRRKAFVAYSSIDSEKAIELVDELEAQGITCFLSSRNLRHGVGSQENYKKFLQEAMDNCMSFVFVSSMNSRNTECDAYEIEMDYVMKKDIKNAPIQLQNFYREIPKEIKKPRVEYRIQESIGENYVDDFVDEFFDGYERVYTIKDVAQRLLRQSRRMDMPISEPTPEPTPIVQKPKPKKFKYCISGPHKCDEELEQCAICGETNFASSLNEAKALKRETEKIQKRREKIAAKKLADEQKAEAKKKKAEKKAAKKEKAQAQIEAFKSKIGYILLWGLIIGVIGALIGLSFVYVNLKVWLIGSAIGVAYIFIWCWLYFKVEIESIVVNVITNILLCISIIALMCFPAMRIYAVCLSVTLFVNSFINFVKFSKICYVNDNKIWTIFVFIIISLIFISLSAGMLFTNLTVRAIFMGCGVSVALIVAMIISKAYLDEYINIIFHIIIFALLSVFCLVVMWINSFFAIFSICAFAGMLIAGIIGGIWEFVDSDDTWSFAYSGVALVLAAVASLTLVFMHLKPKEDIVIENGVLVAYKGFEPVVIIPEDVVRIAPKAFTYTGPKNNLKEVIIPDGVEEIEKTAFINCDALEKVTIAGSVEYIGNSAFKSCDNLAEVVFEKGTLEIGEKAFYECQSIKNVTIPGSVEYIGEYAFAKCNQLSSVTLEKGVYEIGENAFDSCENLTEVIIENGLAKISDKAFYKCSSIKKLTIPGSVKSIGVSAFQSCEKLTEVIIENGLAKISDKAFYKCSSIKKLIIPGSVKSIGVSAFQNCGNLAEVVLEEGVEKLGTKIFKGCVRLKKVTIAGTIETIPSYAFSNCDRLTEIVFGEGILTIDSYAFEKCKNLKNVYLPESLERIANWAFSGCSKISKFYIRKGINSIGGRILRGTEDIKIYYEGSTTEWEKKDIANYWYGNFWITENVTDKIIYDASPDYVIIPEEDFEEETEETVESTESSQIAQTDKIVVQIPGSNHSSGLDIEDYKDYPNPEFSVETSYQDPDHIEETQKIVSITVQTPSNYLDE